MAWDWDVQAELSNLCTGKGLPAMAKYECQWNIKISYKTKSLIYESLGIALVRENIGAMGVTVKYVVGNSSESIQPFVDCPISSFLERCLIILQMPSPGTRYVWVHTKIRPWGHQLPVQCPECWCIRPWVSTSQGLVEFFGCEHCNHWLTFVEPPEKYNWLGGVVFGGRWLAVEHLA